ncbi:MAG: 3-deoxy-manno-octulosonate cytidylyltransferase [Phycisphaerales bacterium]|nr:3-deoxy-manno-octulosonate cytidylyltransferase [Phycisphaerales bacterium]
MFGKKDTKAIAIIPARLGSTRFPRKALADETGKPMVVHVCEQAAKAESVNRVVVATDAEEIKSAVESHGFEAVMTSVEHTNGTSRLAQAAQILKLKSHHIVVNIQGDEPEIEHKVIDGAIAAACLEKQVPPWCPEFGPHGAAVGTVASPIDDREEAKNPNVVKVVIGLIEPDQSIAKAMYFSRALIPHDRDTAGTTRYFRHVGIYAYSVSSLNAYQSLSESPLEQTEHLEQLRWLEHGYPIAVAIRESSHTGIDTPEQYRAFVKRYQSAQSS